MTAKQYRAALAALGLSQAAAGRLLDVHDATARRWAAQGVKGTAAILLWLLAAGKVSIKDVRECGQ